MNVALDLLCVCVFHMGVLGAALATIVSQMLAGVGCLLRVLKTNPYFQFRREDFARDGEMIRRSVRIGLPLAMQWSMIAVSTTVLQSFINGFGTAAVAAYTAISRIEQLVHQPYGSLSTALSTYSGQNYGAARMDRVKDGMKHGMGISLVFTVAMTAFMQLFADGIIGLFVEEAEVILIGARGLRLTAWFYLALALINMARGVLNGVGDALFAFVNGVVEIITRIGLPMLLILIPGMGVDSIWWTNGLTWAISAVFCMLRYFSWRRKTEA